MKAGREPTADGLDGWLRDKLSALDANGRCRDRSITNSLARGWCEHDGRRLLNFASNDYLDLRHDDCVREAFSRTASQVAGSGASALVTGRTEWHRELEVAIADFEGTDAALLFPSGYAANTGTLSAIMTPEDTVFCDRLNHASLIDGCRLAGANFKIYRHDQLDRLDDRLAKYVSRRSFIITDAIFSMDGTIAPLDRICDIAERHNASVIVDEAHATGVLGKHGRGACEACGVEDRVAVRIGTLSKAMGTLGGFVAGSNELIDYLWNSARSQFFSTSLPPAVCAAAAAAFSVARDEPERRGQLHESSVLLRRLLKDILPTGADLNCGVPIVPVVVGSEQHALEVTRRVISDGFLVACIRPPTVPNGTARIRISLSVAHSEADIRCLAESVVAAVHAVGGAKR